MRFSFLLSQFVRSLHPALTAVFLRMAVLPTIAHPSLKISSLGVTAAASLIRKLCADASSSAVGPSASRQLPEWIDLPALLSAFLVRCLRVGDPQALRLTNRQAVMDLEAVAESLLAAALPNAGPTLSAAVLACQEKERSLRREASEAPSDPELLVRAEASKNAGELLQSLPSEPPPPVKAWLRLVRRRPFNGRKGGPCVCLPCKAKREGRGHCRASGVCAGGAGGRVL